MKCPTHCAQHFPPDGFTASDSRPKPSPVDFSVHRRETVDLVPFEAVIPDGVAAVMSADNAGPLPSASQDA